MQIHYNAKKDLLYIRLDERKQEVINRRPSEDIVLDIGEGDRLVGIEIMDASKHGPKPLEQGRTSTHRKIPF